MRIVSYNIRYATGTGPAFHLPVPGAGYLHSNRRILLGITEFLRSERPDIAGLIEVDTGSIRTGMVNQADYIAHELGHYSAYECKYGVSSINHLVPIVRKQANAFLSAPHMSDARFHYFDTGIKRLIIELELEHLSVYLVHLSLKYRQRQSQLRSLHDLIVKARKPVIVAGDFNTFWGTHEIYLFMRAAGLTSANAAGLPSFPARLPRIELDFILVSAGIEVKQFRVPDVRLSDHRPLVCDFEVKPGVAGRKAA
ncbi:MAG: endonuclease/exonuclease/phosphatase family protein [Steroidobacteraceae bacterium]